MRQRWFLLPDAISPTQLASAAAASAGPAVADPAPAWDWVHLGGYLSPTAPPDVLLHIFRFVLPSAARMELCYSSLWTLISSRAMRTRRP